MYTTARHIVYDVRAPLCVLDALPHAGHAPPSDALAPCEEDRLRELLITFDNSMSHHKRHPTGLDATLLNMNDGGKNVPKNIRDGWHYKLEERDRDSSFIGPLRYEKVIQKMQHKSGKA